MIKGRYGVIEETVTTRDVVKVVIALLEKKIDLRKARSIMKEMDLQVKKELQLLGTIVVNQPEEWYIYNAAKAQTRGAFLESLLKYIGDDGDESAECQSSDQQE